MRVALYLRKSTDEQADSTDRQGDNGTRWVKAKGWTVVTNHVHRDEGKSRAEFVRRPGLFALLAGAKARKFDAVVLRDLSRLGGDIFRTGSVVNEILDAGVRIFTYADGAEVTAGNAMQTMMLAFQLYAPHDEREKISGRTREALAMKARAGKVAGGAVYGYRNVPSKEMRQTKNGPRPAWVDREIDPKEATIIREIFTRYAKGEGYGAIAKALNARGVPSPRAGKRGGGAWSKTSIHPMLRRVLYAGIQAWGAQHKTYRSGTKIRTTEHACERVSVELPKLRIIPPDLWDAVQRVHAANARTFRSDGMPKGGKNAVHLLSGILRCGECGSPMKVTNGKRGYDTVRVYICGAYTSGKPIGFGPSKRCGNSLRRPQDDVDGAVLSWVATNLREELVLGAVAEVRKRLTKTAGTSASEIAALEKENVKLGREVERLVSALAVSDTKPEAMLRGIDEREERRRSNVARIKVLRAAPAAVDLELRRLEKEARQKVRSFQATAKAAPEQARALLRALFPKGITADPMRLPGGARFRLDGATALGPLLGFDGDSYDALGGVPSGNATDRTVHEDAGIRARVADLLASAGGRLKLSA